MYRSVKPFIYVTAILLVGLFVADCFDRNQASALTPLAQEAAVATEAAETVETSMPAVEVDDHSDHGAHDDHSGKARAGELHGDEPQPGILANLVTLLALILLQAVLGFDNLLYISLESRRAPADKQKICLLYTSPSPRDLSTSRMPSSA